MGRFYCHCLNVVLNYSGQIYRSESIRSEEMDSIIPNHLCNKRLTPVTLDVAGVILRQSLLVKSYKVGSWLINHCTNCSTDVYAVDSKEQKEKLFVFGNLITDPSVLKNHTDYSLVFQIVLRENMSEPQPIYGESFGQENPVMKTVYAQTESFLAEEEQKMEEAIREYERRRREEFQKFKERVYEDRRRLILSLNEAKVTVINNELSDAGETVNTKEKQNKGKDVTSVTIPIKQDFTKVTRHIIETTNDSDIFDFDEDLVETDVPTTGPPSTASPFPLSSDDDDTDSSSNEGSLTTEDRYNRVRNIPSSLPLSMPFLSNKQTLETVPLQHSPPTTTDLARSIQKLALSVQDTGMFGDLPKPRVKNSHR